MSSACGWFSMIRISSRAAYPDAPTIATPVFVITFMPPSCAEECLGRFRQARRDPCEITRSIQPAQAMTEINKPIATSLRFVFQP